ncbi:hypothetical protein VN12_03650 [Pirellula sp. SH-Sr6A]|uniref:DUF7133 domain-containing protein n=1 Tax=Pirellula sp. SH-Sr6A TaxID=1632865 RepID=UPI00078B99C4|nr:c-type cytochrome [Pirellula sp. SH-Sr6A]AMV31187.1 hypothetical protein VN12_03650 [Pirellula sp. SH-Sr6A]
MENVRLSPHLPEGPAFRLSVRSTLLVAAFLTSIVPVILLTNVPFLMGQESIAKGDDSTAAEDPFVVQDGFEVSIVAGDPLVHDCFAMTLDPEGHPVVSGPGYIKTLFDDNGDGIFDRSVIWSSIPKQGAQGLWAEKRQLYYVGDGGLWLSEDTNGDYIGDRAPRKILNLPTGGEHDAHAIRRGPDGYWYLIVGNFAQGIGGLLNDSASPIQKPRSGTLWRISPDFSTRSVWAHGMRNGYDFDFLPDGQIVTFDSDDERESVLPWYRPTRVMVLGPGSDAGWCGQTWKDGDKQILMPQVLGAMGRSSPTGVAVYEHSAFPTRYRGAVFVLDWTFGRVLAIYPNDNLPEDARAPGRLPAEIFMQTTGTVGFAPTDICVAPDGSLLICVGGRGTAGTLYRVRFQGEATAEETEQSLALALEKSGIERETASHVAAALQAPNPWETWSEAVWTGTCKRSEFDCLLRIVTGELKLDRGANPGIATTLPLRAAQLLTRMGVGVPTRALNNGFGQPHHDRSGLWWLAGRGKSLSDPKEQSRVASWIGSESQTTDLSSWETHLGPNAERLKWEAIGLRRISVPVKNSEFVDSDADWARVLRRTWLWSASRIAPSPTRGPGNVDQLFAKKLYSNSGTLDTPLLDALANRVPSEEPNWNRRQRMEVLAMLQWALGERRTSLTGQQDPPNPDVLDGYRSVSLNQLPANVRSAWVQWVVFIGSKAHLDGEDELESEAIRTLAMLEPTDLKTLRWLLSLPGDESHPTSDIHLLCCVARCTAARSAIDSERTAAILAGVVRKVREYGLNTDNQWPKRLQQLISSLLARDSTLGSSYVRLVDSYIPEDLSILIGFPLDVQSKARSRMTELLWKSDPETWAPALLKHCLPSGEIEKEWDEPIRKAAKVSKLKAIALDAIARNPRSTDYELLLSTLNEEDRNLWEPAWKGLQKLSTLEPSREWPILAKVAFAAGQSKIGIPFAEIAIRCKRVGESCEIRDLPKQMAWELWQPILSRYVAGEGPKVGHDESASSWRNKVSEAKSFEGDAERGQSLYETRCLNCHGGQSALGPSLAGVTKRFSSEDLFVAIFEPSRDISDRYRALKVLTVDGDVLTGMSIYKATDGTTLMTPKGETVRINQKDIEEQSFSKESLMPSGLLDFATPQDLADLLRYLQTL